MTCCKEFSRKIVAGPPKCKRRLVKNFILSRPSIPHARTTVRTPTGRCRQEIFLRSSVWPQVEIRGADFARYRRLSKPLANPIAYVIVKVFHRISILPRRRLAWRTRRLSVLGAFHDDEIFILGAGQLVVNLVVTDEI